MQYIFWGSIFILIYIYAGYLAICILLGTIFKKPIDKKDIFPTISLIIPAFNEETVIAEKIENSLKLNYPKEKLEIIIASESNDQTDSIVTRFADKGIVLYAYKERWGKSKMLFNTMPKTKGEIIVFSDANAMYETDALQKLVRSFNDRRIGAVLGRLIITNPDASSMSQGESIYKKYEGLLRKYNSNLHAILGADGSMLALRRELYLPVSPERGDDFELAIRVRIEGKGVVFEPEAISYEKASTSSSDEIKRKIRIVSGFFRTSFVLLKEALYPFRGLLILQLISNKILRWLSPYFLIVLFMSNLMLTSCKTYMFYRAIFILQGLFYLVALLSGIYLKTHDRKLPGLLRMPVYFIVFNYAFLVGSLRGLLLKQKPFWEKIRD